MSFVFAYIYIYVRVVCIFRKNDLLLIAITSYDIYYDTLHICRKDMKWKKFVS